MSARINIKPNFFTWAYERARLEPEFIYHRFKNLKDWESGKKKPTMGQLQDFAKATHTPFGYFFLPEPPIEKIPIPDLRTVRSKALSRPSPDLLETIYTMQMRQEWLRDELLEAEADTLDFVASAEISDDPQGVGQEMRRIVGLGENWAAEIRTWQEAVGQLRKKIENLEIIAVINSVVGNNTHRKLNVDEFRGFALCDEYAPLIFVNGADAKSAQMFTLGHELAHIWLGKSALTNMGLVSQPSHEIESWCDKAAAEFLVPEKELKKNWHEVKKDESPFEILAKMFKVSPIVIARRALDVGLVSREKFFEFYDEYMTRERDQASRSAGGDFYNIQNARVGERFVLHVILAAKSGRISFKEAYDLTGLHGGAFQEYAKRFGVSLP